MRNVRADRRTANGTTTRNIYLRISSLAGLVSSESSCSIVFPHAHICAASAAAPRAQSRSPRRVTTQALAPIGPRPMDGITASKPAARASPIGSKPRLLPAIEGGTGGWQRRGLILRGQPDHRIVRGAMASGQLSRRSGRDWGHGGASSGLSTQMHFGKSAGELWLLRYDFDPKSVN